MKRTTIASFAALVLAALLGGCATAPDDYYYRDNGYYGYYRDREDPYWHRHAYRDDYYYYPRYGRYYQDRDHGS